MICINLPVICVLYVFFKHVSGSLSFNVIERWMDAHYCVDRTRSRLSWGRTRGVPKLPKQVERPTLTFVASVPPRSHIRPWSTQGGHWFRKAKSCVHHCSICGPIFQTF
jgi:hypothetical protein